MKQKLCVLAAGGVLIAVVVFLTTQVRSAGQNKPTELDKARSEERRVGKEWKERHTRCLSDWSSEVCSSDLQTLRWPRASTVDRIRSTVAFYLLRRSS